MYSACQAKGSRGPAAATAPQLLQKALARLPHKREVRRLCVLRLPGSRGPAAATAPQLLDKALCTAPATQKGSAEALCTAPARQKAARQKAAAGQRRPPRRSLLYRKLCVLRLPRTREVRRLCVLRLPGKRQPRASGGHRAAAPRQSSVYCACQAKAAAGLQRPPRRSSSRKLCVLRLPRTREVRRLCVLRLPGKRQPRASGGHRAAAPLEALCTAPATRARGSHRAAAPPESSMYCACHAKGRLCVLRRQARLKGSE